MSDVRRLSTKSGPLEKALRKSAVRSKPTVEGGGQLVHPSVRYEVALAYGRSRPEPVV